MGDVYDAMNRAQREKQASQPQPRPDVDPPASDQEQPAEPAASQEAPPSERPGLPMDQVHTEPIDLEDASQAIPAAPTPSVATVADAQARAHREQQRLAVEDALHVHEPRPSNLNGYAREVVAHHDRGGMITEQYRAIRTQIVARARNRKVQIHTVTSSVPEEGKSVTTANLGVTFSELKDQRTLLLEADLRKPSFEHLFQRHCEKGVLSYLRGETDSLKDITYETVYDNLHFMPAGGYSVDQSTELLSSARLARLLDRLRDEYDHIFIDTPPVVTVTDPCIVGALADQTLLVVRLNKTPSDAVERAKRLLRAANCEVAGVILTHLHHDVPQYRYRYERYYYTAKK